MKYNAIAPVAVILIILALMMAYYSSSNKPFTCSAKYNVHNDSLRLTLMLRFLLNDDNGIATLNGELTDKAGKRHALNRKIIFGIESFSNNHILTSKLVIPTVFDEVDDVQLNRLLDKFYTQPGQHVQYSVVSSGNGNHFFMSGKTPLFVCSES